MKRISELPLRGVRGIAEQPLDESTWPGTLPAVAQLARDGIDFGAVTVLVGENGSGKSTVIEAVALAYGMSAEGGSTGARHSTRPTESGLWQSLSLNRGAAPSRWGFFLRAETMHGFYTYLEANPTEKPAAEPVFHEMSHGESFLQIVSSRFGGQGLYLLDEPESALSFAGCLALVARLTDMVGHGAQVVLATHSPLVASIPGARILEIGDWGLRECEWRELGLVQNWIAFLDEPNRYLRHLINPD